MNKVVCFSSENRQKGQRTPVDAFVSSPEKWEQIKQSVFKWGKNLKSKQDRFFMSEAEVQKRDFISSQLNDTRYMTKVALDYLKQLGADITTCKGVTTAQVRHWWGLNNLLGETDKKERIFHAVYLRTPAAGTPKFLLRIRGNKKTENISLMISPEI